MEGCKRHSKCPKVWQKSAIESQSMKAMNERPNFDSALEQHCSWCEKAILAGENQIIYGTGNSIQYLFAYHPECEEARMKLLEAIHQGGSPLTRIFCPLKDSKSYLIYSELVFDISFGI